MGLHDRIAKQQNGNGDGSAVAELPAHHHARASAGAEHHRRAGLAVVVVGQDHVRARVLQTDGSYVPVEPNVIPFDAQYTLISRRLRSMLARGRDLLKRRELEGLMALDRQFHRGLAECAGNPVITIDGGSSGGTVVDCLSPPRSVPSGTSAANTRAR